jgi:hypothetical protein
MLGKRIASNVIFTTPIEAIKPCLVNNTQTPTQDSPESYIHQECNKNRRSGCITSRMVRMLMKNIIYTRSLIMHINMMRDSDTMLLSVTIWLVIKMEYMAGYKNGVYCIIITMKEMLYADPGWIIW